MQRAADLAGLPVLRKPVSHDLRRGAASQMLTVATSKSTDLTRLLLSIAWGVVRTALQINTSVVISPTLGVYASLPTPRKRPPSSAPRWDSADARIGEHRLQQSTIGVIDTVSAGTTLTVEQLHRGIFERSSERPG